MSIIKNGFSTATAIFAQILLLAIVSAAQDIEAVIKIVSPGKVKVEGRILGKHPKRANENWSFRLSIAGIENLGARISEFKLSDESNRPILFKELAGGEYLADEKASGFDYLVDLRSSPNVAAMAHISSLSSERGILMLDDLLPPNIAGQRTVSARIKFDVPAGWKIISSEKNAGENAFHVENIEKAIFSIGKSWREQKVQVGKTVLDLAISGDWNFSDAEAAKMAGEIYAEHQKLFGESPTDTVQIFLVRAAPEIKFGRWAAETRGANTTIVSADKPFKTQSLQLLHEQLRHEIFHLWVPNNLALTGNYDWFYEGFTIYQALRTGVSMNQIGFEDFLDTLAQAYQLNSFQNEKLSLIESSKNRWRAANNQIYARGLLAAFSCDVALLRASRGKRSISTIFREIYEKHRVPNNPQDGSAAILKIFNEYSELDSTIEKYIVGAEKTNWNTDLETVGIEATEEQSVLRLRVKAKLSGKQKDLLNELGYNNWRKMSGKGK